MSLQCVPNWEARSATVKLIYCADFAAQKHKDQRRKDGETPYINHPIGVAKILTEEGGVEDVNVIQAALLHDTLEDTETTLEELEREFGPTIAGIVLEVSDDGSLDKAERKRVQVVSAPHKSHSAKLVRLADKIYNLRDLNRVLPEGWTEERRLAYFEWAELVVQQMYDANERMASILRELFAAHRENILKK